MLEALKDREYLCEVCKLRRAVDTFDHSLVCEQCRVVMERTLSKEGELRETLEAQIPPMRSKLEVQRSHDILMQALADADLRTRIFPNEMLMGQAIIVAQTLCWVLEHDDHNGEKIADLLNVIELGFVAAGLSMELRA
jgi:hypothetical protein